LSACASPVNELANAENVPLNLSSCSPQVHFPSGAASRRRGSASVTDEAREPHVSIPNAGDNMHLGPSASSNLQNHVFSSSSSSCWGRGGGGGEAACDGGKSRRLCKILQKSNDETYLGSAGFRHDRGESTAWRRACGRKGNHRRTTVSQSKLKTFLLVPLGCGGVHVLVPSVG